MTTVNKPAAHPQLGQWYEDLRAQATGQMPAATPRGLALLLGSGLPAWMAACPPVMTPGPALARAATPVPVTGTPAPTLGDLSAQVVGILTEMAMGSMRRCST